MEYLQKHTLRVSYRGGLASDHLLPSYDGATSIYGFSQGVAIATHAFLNSEVVSRATALKKAKIVMKPARQGSFIFELIILMEAYPATSTAGVALSAPVFYDFIKASFKRATGFLDAEPETTHLKKIYQRKDPPPLKKPPVDLDELAETLEGSLQRAHRPIGDEGTIQQIDIGSPKQKLIELNADTKDWVNTQETDARLEVFTGNVTRYNTISRNGRAFVDQLDRVVPVRPDGDFSAGDLQFLTWSLHGSNIGTRNKLEFRARRVVSASGKVKRLLLSDAQREPSV